jgi:hypothetical protein
MSLKLKLILVACFLLGMGLLYYAKTHKEIPTVEPKPVALSTNQETFIKRFLPLALSESKKFNIPVSVIMAVAVTNSECYDHPSHHNIFLLKADSTWEGETITYGTLDTKPYTLRKYETAWASFRDFSITVTNALSRSGVEKERLTVDGWVGILAAEGYCNAVETMKTVGQFKHIDK